MNRTSIVRIAMSVLLLGGAITLYGSNVRAVELIGLVASGFLAGVLTMSVIFERRKS
jgi:hypothetical protein